MSPEPVLIGDFNIDPVKHASTYAHYIELLRGFNLTQHVAALTHIHGGVLDHFITLGDSDLLDKKIVINDCLSDHMCLLACLNANLNSSSTPKSYSFRKYNSIDLTALKKELSSTQLITSPCLTSCADLYDQYATTLTSLLDKYAPLYTSKYSRPAEKWLSTGFFEAKRKKRDLERKWRRTKTAVDRSKFCQQVNKCNSILRVSKSQYYSDLVAKNQDDSKKLWQTINKILHRTKSSTIPDDTSDLSLANKFGSYFIEKIMKIRTTFTSNDFHISPPVEPVAKFSSFNSVSCNDVRKILNLSPTKSCSLDPWPTFLVKECVDILINPLTQMINMSLSEGYFSDKFKTAIVTPLLKKPSLDKSVLKNYRPVSGLNFVSKLIERTVSKQLKDYLSLNNLGNIYQSAYKAGHSTETTLLKIKSDIHLNLAQGQPTALVLLDLSAAFDTIDHLKLFDCLSYMVWLFRYNFKLVQIIYVWAKPVC